MRPRSTPFGLCACAWKIQASWEDHIGHTAVNSSTILVVEEVALSTEPTIVSEVPGSPILGLVFGFTVAIWLLSRCARVPTGAIDLETICTHANERKWEKKRFKVVLVSRDSPLWLQLFHSPYRCTSRSLQEA